MARKSNFDLSLSRLKLYIDHRTNQFMFFLLGNQEINQNIWERGGRFHIKTDFHGLEKYGNKWNGTLFYGLFGSHIHFQLQFIASLMKGMYHVVLFLFIKYVIYKCEKFIVCEDVELCKLEIGKCYKIGCAH